MRIAGRVVRVALVAGCAVSVAACGTSPVIDAATVRTVKPKISDPLAGMSGAQIAAKAVADTLRAPTVTMDGMAVSNGSRLDMHVVFAGHSNCEGTVGYQGKGTIQIAKQGGTVWIRPDDAFWRANGASASEIDMVGGKYFSLTSADRSYADFAPLCSALSQNTSSPTHVSKSPVTWVNGGQQVVVLTDRTDGSRLYVSDTPAPVIVREDGGRSDAGTLNFTAAQTATTISPPPSDATLNGAQYGF